MLTVEPPLFVCGFPSGGTDLTVSILNAHPSVCLSGEMPWLSSIGRWGYDQLTVFKDLESVRRFQCLIKRLDRWHSLANLSHDFAADLDKQGPLSLAEVLKTCCCDSDARVWGNKTPQNTENVDALLHLFPDARFLVVTRDVRDVCLSWKRKWGKNMVWCAAKWAERMAKGKAATDGLSPDRALNFKFEDMLVDPKMVCDRICRFLNMPFSQRMLEHHKYTDQTVGGKVNFGRPIKRDNFNKWEKALPERTVRRIEGIACETMKTLGYHPAYESRPRPLSRAEKVFGVLHDSWAVLFIGNRYSRRNSLRHRLRKLRTQLVWRLTARS